MESAWQCYVASLDLVCAPLALTIKQTWMSQEYVTMLQAYIHDRDKTAINIESSTFEVASPQRGKKRNYRDVNDASPQRGGKRLRRDANAASLQCGEQKDRSVCQCCLPSGIADDNVVNGSNFSLSLWTAARSSVYKSSRCGPETPGELRCKRCREVVHAVTSDH